MDDTNSRKWTVVVFVCKGVFHGVGAGEESKAAPFKDLALSPIFNQKGVKLQGKGYKYLDQGGQCVLILVIDLPERYSGHTDIWNTNNISDYSNWISGQIKDILDRIGTNQHIGLTISSCNIIYVCSHFGGGTTRLKIEQETIDIQRANDDLKCPGRPTYKFCNISRTFNMPDFLYRGENPDFAHLSATSLIEKLDNAIAEYRDDCKWEECYDTNMNNALLTWRAWEDDMIEVASENDNTQSGKKLMLLIVKGGDERGEWLLRSLHETIKMRQDVKVAILSFDGNVAIIDKGEMPEWHSTVDWIRELQSGLGPLVDIYAFIAMRPKDVGVFGHFLTPWFSLLGCGHIYGYYASSDDGCDKEDILLNLFSDACATGPRSYTVELKEEDLHDLPKNHYDEIMKGMGHGDD